MADDEKFERLNGLVATHAVFYQKLRNYHWNVTGPAFFQLHDKFEEMYLRTAEEVDSLAERVLALGGRPYSTLGEFLEYSVIKEDRKTPDSSQMVKNVREDIKKLLEANRNTKKLAEKDGDDTTVNLLDDIADQIEEDAWMLRAWLG